MPSLTANRRLPIWTVVGALVLLIWAIIVLYPLFWSLLASFKDNPQMYTNAVGFPTEWRFENYAEAWQSASIGSFFFNSVVVTAITVALGAAASMLAAYVIARFPSRFTRLIFWLLTTSMMLPIVLTLVPKFLILRDLSLLDTRAGLILIYVSAGIPFGVFLLHSFFATIPRSIEESAYLDGAGYFRTFVSIIAPIAAPGVMVVSVFLFLRSWNEIYHAMIMLSSEDKYTIPVGIVRLVEVQQHAIRWGPIFASVVIVIVPILVFYLFAQRRIVEGLASGAIKG